MSESDTQRLILDYLSAKRIWHIRLNTGAMSGSHKGKRWFVKFGKPGMGDILACWKGGFLWIEVKADEGKQAALQAIFQQEVEAEGMLYVLAHCLEDVQAIIG